MEEMKMTAEDLSFIAKCCCRAPSADESEMVQA